MVRDGQGVSVTLSVGVDVGGTKIAAGVVGEDGAIVAELRAPTPTTSSDEILALIVSLIEKLRVDRNVESIGIGVPGLVDVSRSVIQFTPNLPWRHEPLAANVSAACGLPVILENDANAAAWAEAQFGAGRGHRNLVAITVGTGIGGGVVLDGRLFRGENGMAGEVGHMSLNPAGPLCNCGNHGCWESLASGRALVRLAQAGAADRPERATKLLELSGGRWQDIEGTHVTTAAQAGDEIALATFAEVGRWLGLGMVSVASLLDVSLFVLGGGVASAGELLRKPAEAALTERLVGEAYRKAPMVLTAELGANAGLVGAASLSLELLAV
jgi:glucokinase